MKKFFLFLCIVLILSVNSFAGTYYVKVIDNTFIPSELNVKAGDQIIWTLFDGSHTTTSMTVPSGAAAWNYQFTGAGDTYTYAVTVPGTYTYECIFHPGMTGTFDAASGFPLIENFDYPAGDSIRLYGWNITGTILTNPVMVTSPGLSYSGYPLSGIGNAAGLATSGADVNKEFPDTVFSGSVYASAMVSINSAQGGDYFMHFGVSPLNTTVFMGRVFVRLAANGNYAFGVSKSSTSTSILPAYSDSIYTAGTHLLILKYKFNPGVNDDSVFLYVNPVLSSVEPAAAALHGTSTANDPSSLGTINLRQGSSSLAAALTIDGIKVGLTWSDVVPVELTSFTASPVGNNINLKWTTATEVNNSGFEIQRMYSNKWEKIGFVNGNGTRSEQTEYTFTDKNLEPGKYAYRLRQIDHDGTFSYSPAVETEIGTPLSFSISQNYPNPFNPSTSISFALPEAGNIKLVVYNLLGQQIRVLVNEYKSAGSYTIDFNADNLNSGIYLYKIEYKSFTEVKKMTLLK
jgi:hypothetical protein